MNWCICGLGINTFGIWSALTDTNTCCLAWCFYERKINSRVSVRSCTVTGWMDFWTCALHSGVVLATKWLLSHFPSAD